MDELTDTVTLKLTGCSGGIGVGLDKDNKVDLIKPDTPAAKFFFMGDQIISWNDQEMVKVEGGRKVQRLLKDVVTPAETHTVVVKRAKANNWSTDYSAEAGKASWESQSWDSNSWSS